MNIKSSKSHAKTTVEFESICEYDELRETKLLDTDVKGGWIELYGNTRSLVDTGKRYKVTISEVKEK